MLLFKKKDCFSLSLKGGISSGHGCYYIYRSGHAWLWLQAHAVNGDMCEFTYTMTIIELISEALPEINLCFL